MHRDQLRSRIGIAYSPFASNRTVIRAGYGVFHASLNAATAQNIPNNISQQSASITVFDDPNLRGFPLPDFNFRALTNITALPKDPKAAYMQHWNLNIQQGLGDQAMLQVAYLGNRGLHLSGGQNLNRFISRYAHTPVSATSTRRATILPRRTTPCRSVSGGGSIRRSLRTSNYTWAHTLDDGGILFSTAPRTTPTRGRNMGTATWTCATRCSSITPMSFQTRLDCRGWLGGGWQINGITVLRGGLPVIRPAAAIRRESAISARVRT